MSLLSIIQEAAGSLNQPVPNVVFGSTVGDAVLWRNLAQQEASQLSRRHDWQGLIVQHTWTTTATVVQASALPSDYDRLPPDPEVWDRTGNKRLVGPVSSREWQILNSSGVTGGSAGWWRITGVAAGGGNELNIYPAPTAGLTYALEYITKNWCQTASGDVSAYVSDGNVTVFPEYLVALGITWRWLRAKGMDYAEEMSTYEREVEKAAARDRGMNVMIVGGSRSDDELPQTWNGTIT